MIPQGFRPAFIRSTSPARNYDLSVVAQSEPESDPGEALIIHAALFDSGRPVLVVPYIQSGPMALDRVMVCWNGSKSAARAIGDALPLLQRAGQIDVVSVDDRDRRNELRSADIAAHLARHGLNVELKPVVAPDSDVANVILSQAADNATGLMVLGGFGHSRFREFVLGGATRGILGASDGAGPDVTLVRKSRPRRTTMPWTDIVTLCAAFGTFGLALAYGQYQTRDVHRVRDESPTRKPPAEDERKLAA